MALVLLRVQGRKPYQGNCVDEYCVTVHTHGVDFNSAQKSCEAKGGHLMTLRTGEANSAISDLLTGLAGNFWIGLRYTREICSESSRDLKGYSWVTGDEVTNFTNWKNDEKGVCSQTCVSVSTEDLKWTGRACNRAAEGYLCGYKNIDTCRPLSSESPVLYDTPFGFAREDLQEVPNTSNATSQHLGTKFICSAGDWHRAPWNCEVYKGGCEHKCSRLHDVFFCTCLPGYTLESNAVSCRKTHGDPCLHTDCSLECGKDGKACKDVDRCDDKSLCPDENSYCVRTAGGFECRCKIGFSKEMDACIDEDECFSGPCEHSCNNTPGSYDCECSEGYQVSSEDRHKCTLYCPNSECQAVACDLNNPHQCDCPDGFILEERSSGYFCIDINECDTSICDYKCNNTPGGYSCYCDEGFHLVGKSKCVKTKGLSTTTSRSISTPTSTPPSIETASFSAGAVLGIIVCTVMVILLTVCIIHHNMKRCGNITTAKDHSKDAHALQQVTTEKYVKKLSIPNINYS